MINKFQTLNNLYLVETLERSYRFTLVKNGIEYCFHRHDTGEGINIYLVDGDDRLHVYYDYNWFNSRYQFNEEGKKHGYLVNGPWEEIIEGQFDSWDTQIVAYKAKFLAEKIAEEESQKSKEEKLVEKFKKKFQPVEKCVKISY